MNLKDKNVLITGGTRGIGFALVEKFLEQGANVFTTGTSENSLKDLKSKLPKLNPDNLFPVDFASPQDFTAFCKEISKQDIEILINNAGINKIGDSEEISMEDWDRINRVNLRAPMELSQAVIPSMRKKNWGRIINLTSIFAVVSKEKRVSYSSSKFGLIGQSKALSLDLAPQNILVNCISPGFIDTELTRKVLGDEGIKELTAQVPLKRLGRPEEIANIALFLASGLNSFITGQNIIADGGFTSA